MTTNEERYAGAVALLAYHIDPADPISRFAGMPAEARVAVIAAYDGAAGLLDPSERLPVLRRKYMAECVHYGMTGESGASIEFAAKANSLPVSPSRLPPGLNMAARLEVDQLLATDVETANRRQRRQLATQVLTYTRFVEANAADLAEANSLVAQRSTANRRKQAEAIAARLASEEAKLAAFRFELDNFIPAAPVPADVWLQRQIHDFACVVRNRRDSEDEMTPNDEKGA